MEQQLNLDLPKKFMECKENIEDYVKVLNEAVEVVVEEAKLSGSQKAIDSALAVQTNVMEALIPSNKETAENYEAAAEELSRLFAVLN